MLPVTLHISITSFILLMHLMKVDLPHPDGPINAVTSFSFKSNSHQTMLVYHHNKHSSFLILFLILFI